MIYTCDTCHFLFERSAEPEQCPDCGKHAIRPASAQEQKEYQERLREAQGRT